MYAANEAIAILTKVFPVKSETNNFRGLFNKEMTLGDTLSRWVFTLKYAVSVPEKNADNIIKHINIEINSIIEAMPLSLKKGTYLQVESF